MSIQLGRRVVIFISVLGLTLSLGTWATLNQARFEVPSSLARQTARHRLEKNLEVPINTLLVPGARSSSKWILQDGFSQPDLDGAWMTATNGRITFSVIGKERPVRLLLAFVPFVAPMRPSRTIAVRSSIDKKSVVLTGPTTILEVGLDGDSLQEVEFTCDSVDSPYSLRVGGDQRKLCAKLLSLTVRGA
jgi:hypothetical protein